MLDTPILADAEAILALEPLSNITHELARLTGKLGATRLNDSQADELFAYGKIAAQHKFNDQDIYILRDDFFQSLVLIKNANAPHFALTPN